jgi:hypothetical protein
MTNVPSTTPSFETARSSCGTKPSSRHDGRRLIVPGKNNEQCGYPCPIEGERSGLARAALRMLPWYRPTPRQPPDSDIDIMIEIDPEAHVGVFDDVGLKDYIAELFEARGCCEPRGTEILYPSRGDSGRDLGLQNRPTPR